MKAAEGADNRPLREGVDIPAEIARREDRIKKLQQAQRAIEERHAREAAEQYEEECKEHLEKTKLAVAKTLLTAKMEKAKSHPIPPRRRRSCLTIRHSTTLPIPIRASCRTRARSARPTMRKYPSDTESMLIAGHHLSQKTNDKKELIAGLDSIAKELSVPEAALADSGFFSKENIENAPKETELYISPGRTKHNQSIEERLGAHATGDAPEGATPAEAMRHKLRTE